MPANLDDYQSGMVADILEGIAENIRNNMYTIASFKYDPGEKMELHFCVAK